MQPAEPVAPVRLVRGRARVPRPAFLLYRNNILIIAQRTGRGKKIRIVQIFKNVWVLRVKILGRKQTFFRSALVPSGEIFGGGMHLSSELLRCMCGSKNLLNMRSLHNQSQITMKTIH